MFFLSGGAVPGVCVVDSSIGSRESAKFLSIDSHGPALRGGSSSRVPLTSVASETPVIYGK